MTETYKLLAQFPGSPEAGSIAIATIDNDNLFEIYNDDGKSINSFIQRKYIQDYPDYWQLLIPHKEDTFSKSVSLSFNEEEYESMMKLVRIALKENISEQDYYEATSFFENYEKNNYIGSSVTLNVPYKYVKVLTNSLGSIIYSHSKISIKKRKELKKILTRIENRYDYINNLEGKKKTLANLIISLKNIIK